MSSLANVNNFNSATKKVMIDLSSKDPGDQMKRKYNEYLDREVKHH